MQIQDIAKKTPGSRALFNYISNKQRNCRYLDLKRLTEFFRLDDTSVTYEDILACCSELSAYGYGKVEDGKFICLKPLQTLSLKPWVKERRRAPRNTQRRPSTLPPSTQSKTVLMTLGGLKIEVPADKTKEIFEVLRRII